RQRFELAPVVHDCVELVRPLTAERHVQIQCELEPIIFVGDADRIGQVVTNLVTNAIRFNREAGTVTVTAKVENGNLVLRVSDTGEGISPEDQPHIFERFFRGEPSRSRSRGSNGLGLAICKAIVEAHGGTIEMQTELGKGSAFTVILPCESNSLDNHLAGGPVP